ncbi:MAG: hypothetical protein AAGC72_14470 [Planctomycetota bacterium]
MARKLKKTHCWKKTRVVMGPGYVEVRERKLWATVGLVFMLAWPIGLISVIMAASSSAGIDREMLIILAVVLSIPALVALALYRLPRVLRLYPEEKVAQRYRAVFQTALFSRWEDLSDEGVQVHKDYFVEQQADESGGQALLGCVFALMGPVGLLLALGTQKKREVRTPVYTIRCRQALVPLLVVENRKVAQRAVELYEALADTGPSSDLTSSY